MAGNGAERVAFETARLRLAEIRGEGEQALAEAYRAVCRQSATALSVERVSIWFLSPRGDAMECKLQYDKRTDEFTSGERLERKNCDRYFAAVESRRVVIAEDCLSDPRTQQLEAYLGPAGVGALLDAPIYRDGHVTGVVCHEHVGTSRSWDESEASFATTVADLLTMLIQQAEQAELRAALDARRQMEAEHRKMDALLRMGRVVVHDLSNVLTIAAARAEEADERAGSTGAESMADVIEYGTKLLRQLRDFCERVEPVEEVRVRTTLLDLEPTLRNLLGSAIELEFGCEVEEAVMLPMSPLELEQLCLNLCMNAKDAIGTAGKVTLRATKVGGAVMLEVRDTGCGMDQATQARLFEPFYSTKKGHSGVGLSAVYGIVDRIGGIVHVQSTRGKGSTFTVELPVARAKPKAPGAARPSGRRASDRARSSTASDTSESGTHSKGQGTDENGSRGSGTSD